jgi:hypothetical protein
MNPAKNPNEPTFGQSCVTRLKASVTRIAVPLVVGVGIICAVPAAGSEEMPSTISAGPSQAGQPLGNVTAGNGFLPATSGGSSVGSGTGNATTTGDESAQQSASEFGIRDAASLGMGLLPVVGSVLSLVEFVTAYDYVADRPANRMVAAAGIGAGLIPGGKVGLKGLTRIAGAAVRSADELADVARGAARAAGSVDNAAVAAARGGITGNVGGRAPEFVGGRIGQTGFLDAAAKYLGSGYLELSPGTGRYISADGLRQVRFGAHEVRGSGLHGHFEAYGHAGGRVIENTRVDIIGE